MANNDPLASSSFTPTDSTPTSFSTTGKVPKVTKGRAPKKPKITVKMPKGTGLKGFAQSMKLGSKAIKASAPKANFPKMGKTKPTKYVVG